MLKMISKFAASPFSGYALIALLIAAAGAGYWFWSELKEFGSLQAKSVAQQETIQQQRNRLQILAAETEAKDEALKKQTKRSQILMRNAKIQERAVQEAIKYADKVTQECMALHLADGLQFGPSSKDGDNQGKTRSDVDG